MDAMSRCVNQVIESARFRPDFLPERMMERFVDELVREWTEDPKVLKNCLRRLANEAKDAADKI